MIQRVTNVIKKLRCILTRAQLLYGIAVLFAALIAALLETIGVSIVIPLVSAMLDPQKIRDNQIVNETLSILGIQTEQGIVFLIVSSTIFIYLLKNLYFIFFAWLKYRYSCKVQRECSLYMLESYLNRGYSFFLHVGYNEVSEGINGDVARLYTVITGLIQIISQVMIALCIGIFMLIADWQIALSILAASAICLALIVTVYRRKMLYAGKQIRDYGVLASQSLYECIQGIKETFVLRKQSFFLTNYKINTIKRQRAEVAYNVGVESPAYIIEGLCVSAIMIVLFVRVLSLDSPSSFVATLAAFAVGAFRILPALGKISSSANSISAVAFCLDKVYENIVEARSENDAFFNINMNDDLRYANHVFAEMLKGEKLTFSYGNSLENVIDGLSIQIPKGKSIALVGESGAGKSTLADIFLGVLQPSSGRILLDGIDIKEIPNRWSRMIGFVPQSIYLYDKSVKENVAFGELKEDIDTNAVIDALQKAKLLDFIMSLPNGLDTYVGDRGVRLSGGQRQRLGIARALYRNPEILVLDEATSALDSETESSVMEAIDSLQGQITMIIIAHRLSTIRNCDYIYEITDGKAVERKYADIV